MPHARWIAVGGAIALAAVAAPAGAEDGGRGAGYVAEGPAFDLPADMRVERQEMHVALDSIRLVYVFHASTRRTVHFRFVLPAMPVDASPDAIGLDGQGEVAGLAADRRPLNYLDLSVRVNGAPLALSGRGRALHRGRDVTRQLLDAAVPLLYHLDEEAPWRRLPARTQAMLDADGLLVLDTADWSYQADFEWDQRFEPGDTRVEIRYVPVADYWSDINSAEFPEIAPGGPATRTYCIDDALRRAYFRHPAYDLFTIAHGWAAPAGRHGRAAHYRLVVDKGAAANMVAFCPAAARKTAATTFEWSAADVKPDRSFGALFFIAPDQ